MGTHIFGAHALSQAVIPGKIISRTPLARLGEPVDGGVSMGF